jgi:Ribbon-helix-helix protein, copG family
LGEHLVGGWCRWPGALDLVDQAYLGKPKYMTTSIRKRRVGRPATGRDPNVGIRIPKQVIVVIDRMARDQHTTRAAIVREIVMKHLGFKPKL